MATKSVDGMLVTYFGTNVFRLRTSDGRYVFVNFHSWLGPIVSRDKAENRQIEDWFNDEPVARAVDWWIQRGKIA